MLVPTVDFAVFFIVVFAASWLLRSRPLPWRLLLLAASLFFYGYWDERFVALIGASILANHLLAGRVAQSDGRARKGWVGLAVAANLGVLGWFKYWGFFVDSVLSTARQAGVDLPEPAITVVLPVGISFFTFQALSYVIDVHRRDIEPLPFLDFAVFLSFFPQLVAGPIVRATELAPQLGPPERPVRLESTRAFRLIFAGLFKKVVVSSYLATEIVDPVFAVPGEHSGPEILMATYAYAVQIYADFSGYTDMAIGCALLLGFRFPDNFNAPYIATSIQDFWRRWHMSLSRWLRDYLYISLGGNRRGRIFTYRNLFLTMVLGGLWHGAAWTFVIWGAIHGGLLAVERGVKAGWSALGRPLRPPRPVVLTLQWLYTFHAVCLAWIFFRADSTELAVEMIRRIITTPGAAPLVSLLLVVTVVASLASQFVPQMLVERADRFAGRVGPIALGVALAGGFVLVDGLGPEGVAPFIYFQF